MFGRKDRARLCVLTEQMERQRQIQEKLVRELTEFERIVVERTVPLEDGLRRLNSQADTMERGLAELGAGISALHRDVNEALDLEQNKTAGALVNEGIQNLMNYTGQPQKKRGEA